MAIEAPKKSDIVSETQTIAVLIGPSPNEVFWCAHVIPQFAGANVNCDRIDPYYESHGQGCTAMLRIVKDERTIARVNAMHLDEIRYLKP